MPIANMANAAALIWETLPDLNWAGSIATSAASWCWGRSRGGRRASGLPSAQGVCGAAAASRQVQRVDDVHAFDGHIACEPHRSANWWCRSMRDGELVAVLDLDSPTAARFDAEDEAGCVALAEFWLRCFNSSPRQKPGSGTIALGSLADQRDDAC